MMPAAFGLLVLILLSSAFKHDTIIYLVQNRNKDEAIHAIKKMYRMKSDDSHDFTYDEVIEAHYEYLC